MYDLIIVGSGPAGLSAAIYAQRARLACLTLEKEPMSGGQVINTSEVDNYPGLPGINGFDLAMKLREHAENLGAEFEEDEVVGLSVRPDGTKVICCADGEYATKAVILAGGARHRKLGVPGEDTFAGKGVSYCAVCDGAFYRGKRTAVVGGGDVAVEDAIFLARMCEKVYLIHRRDSLRAAASLQERVQNLENVEILWNTSIREIRGQDGVEQLVLASAAPKAELSAAEFQSETEEKILPVDGLFIAVGIQPNSGVFDSLEKDAGGYLVADETGTTSVPGVFAAGDIRTKPLRQIVTAVADGANAVASAEKYLSLLSE